MSRDDSRVSTDPSTVVENFLQACTELDIERALHLIDDNCVYQNVPFHTARGRATIERDLTAMTRALNKFDIRMTHVAVTDNAVMTERVDTLSGRFFKVAIPLMGVFIVERGKIVQWRDYFDWSSAFGKMSRSVLTRWFRR